MTAPLTPADCDLRDFAYMPLDAARMLDSDLFALSTGDEFKAAIALWCKAWTQVPAASLPDDDRVLAHLSGAGARWKKVKEMALRGFIRCDDGRLYHPVVAEKALDAWERRTEFKEKRANKTGRQQRWRDRVKEISSELRGLGITPPLNASLASLEDALRDAQETDGRRLRRQLREGEGERKGEEEEKHNKGGFAFDGAVIRLRRNDFDRWQGSYPDLDLAAVLQARDDWLRDQPETERKRWFNSTSNFLAKKQQDAKTAAKKADTYVYPIA